MRFDESVEGRARNLLENEAKKQSSFVDEYDARQIRIPLKIDDAIIIRSLANMAHMARSKIIGAMQGNFILVTEPTVNINDRISAVLDGGFLCSYFSEGNLYNFHSRYRKHLIENVVCIEYPKEVEVRQVRKHRRIRVNIETECVVCGMVESFFAEMGDISFGGCRLVFNDRVPMAKGTDVYLTFSLPNEAYVSKLQSVVVRFDRIKNTKTTEVGVTFSGPQSEIAKISNFCEFCMFFDLE